MSFRYRLCGVWPYSITDSNSSLLSIIVSITASDGSLIPIVRCPLFASLSLLLSLFVVGHHSFVCLSSSWIIVIMNYRHHTFVCLFVLSVAFSWIWPSVGLSSSSPSLLSSPSCHRHLLACHRLCCLSLSHEYDHLFVCVVCRLLMNMTICWLVLWISFVLLCLLIGYLLAAGFS